MYIIIPLFIIVTGAVIIAFIVVRKFPQVANLDVRELPEERQSKKKREILGKRLEGQAKRAKQKLRAYSGPAQKLWRELQLRFRVYMGKIERLWYHEQTIKERMDSAGLDEADKRKKAEYQVQEAEQELKQNNWEKAEELFIAAAKLDAKFSPAYRGLADTYLSKGSLEEARETYRFVLQLEPDDDSVLTKLAGIAESQGDLEEAIDYYERAIVVNGSLAPRFYYLAELLVKVGHPEVAREAIVQAVELEPQNPKHLDLLIEIAILCNDKELAMSGFYELRLVNPDNQKLESFKDRIQKIKATSPEADAVRR